MNSTSGSLTTRLATINDVDVLVSLIQYAFRGGKPNKSWTGEEHLVRGPRITPEKLVKLIEQKNGAVIVCEAGNEASRRTVGCIHVEQQDSHGHVAMLAVDPDEQSGGIGKTLMDAAAGYARSKFHANKLVGEVVSFRPELLSWYERLGYRVTGETKPFFGPEHGVEPLVENLHFIVIELML